MTIRLTLVSLLTSAATATAQALTPAPAPPSAPWTLSGEPATAPAGWTLQPTDGATTSSPAAVQRRGPGVAIATADALVLRRNQIDCVGASQNATSVLPSPS